jgi:hypothetical protein
MAWFSSPQPLTFLHGISCLTGERLGGVYLAEQAPGVFLRVWQTSGLQAALFSDNLLQVGYHDDDST